MRGCVRPATTAPRLRSLAARYHPELDGKKWKAGGESSSGITNQKQRARRRKPQIVSWNLRALWWETARKAEIRNQNLGTGKPLPDKPGKSGFQLSEVKSSGPYRGFIEVGRRFALRVREDLKRRASLPADAIFFAYDTGALEALEWCREHGVKCVLNQMDPNRVEVDLVRAEEKQWPGWALEALAVPETYFARREREWALADRVVVNSEFSRKALLQQGVPTEKLVVIPLCYEAVASNRKS